FVKEVAGVVTTGDLQSLTLPGPNAVDLYLTVDPAASTIQAAYTITNGTSTGPLTNVGTAQPIPSSWLSNATSGTAVGIIATSGAAPTFPVTWDFMEVLPVGAPVNMPPNVNAGANQAITFPAAANLSGTASDDGLPNGTLTTSWSKFAGPGTVSFGNVSALATSASFSIAGVYTLRLTASDGQLSNSSDVAITVNSAGSSTPFGGTPASVPGQIEAENFDDGGEGVAYHDTDTSNQGGAYRTTGVDIQATGDSGGGFNVGWVKAGEWLQYTINATSAITANFNARVASSGSGGTFHINIDGTAVPGTLT